MIREELEKHEPLKDLIDKAERYKKLFLEKQIDQQEFDTLKAQLLDLEALKKRSDLADLKLELEATVKLLTGILSFAV